MTRSLLRRLNDPPREPLPFPALAEMVVERVEDLLIAAWERVQAGGNALRGEHETVLNAEMVNAIDELLAERPEFSALFHAISSAEEFDDYSGVSLQEKCDLVLQLAEHPPGVVRRRYWSAFVECKRIDYMYNKSINLYVREGINRFSFGKYAWKMVNGFLLAYVFDDSRPESAVPDASPRHGVAPSVCVVRSVHSREWKYADGTPAGVIRLSHTWVS
jgi:hypothetical protein